MKITFSLLFFFWSLYALGQEVPLLIGKDTGAKGEVADGLLQAQLSVKEELKSDTLQEEVKHQLDSIR